MVQWLKRIGYGLLIVVGAVVIFGLMLPSKYAVETSVVINAEPSLVNDYTSDLAQWLKWMPRFTQDPTIEVEYGTSTRGVGGNLTWKGKGGEGYITIKRSGPDGIDYETIQGGKETKGALRYDVLDEGTKITWSIDGDVGGSLPGRYGLLFGSEADMQATLDSGLQTLKQLVETPIEETPPAEGETPAEGTPATGQ